MQIIKRGTPPGERKYRVGCHHCRTEFEFERPEARYKSVQRGDGDYLAIDCPVCDSTVTTMVADYVR
jgi:hypothetical protein